MYDAKIMSVQTFLNNVDNVIEISKRFTVYWSKTGVGFGQLDFYNKDDKIHISNECMDKRFIKAILCKMVDDAVLEDPPIVITDQGNDLSYEEIE